MGYNLINWENSPSKQTPINAENLNQMDVNIAKAIQGTRFNFSATFTADNVLKNKTSTEALGAGSFATSQTDIVTVFVADNVTKINNGAFSNCTSLKTIYIDNTVGNVDIVTGAVPSGVSIVYSDDDNFINVNDLLASAIRSLKSLVNENRTDWENRATSIETQHKTDVQALTDKANSIVEQANTDRQNFNNSVDEINTKLETKENVSNKVSVITHPSLDYYPDTKAVFDYVNSKLETPLSDIESLKSGKLDKTDFNAYKTATDKAVKDNADNIKLLDTNKANLVQSKNLFDMTSYLNFLNELATKSVVNGTLDNIDSSNFTFTTTGHDCYTNGWISSKTNFKIQVQQNTTYTMSWDFSGSDGFTFVFFNGVSGSGNMVQALSSKKMLTFTTKEDTTFVTVRFGINDGGTSATIGKIQIEEGTESTTYLPSKVSEGVNEVDKAIADNTNSIKANTTAINKCVADIANNLALISKNQINVTTDKSTNIVLNDSSDCNIVGLTLYGKSTQSAVPSPTNPVDINSVENPSITFSNKKSSQNLQLNYILRGVDNTCDVLTINSDGTGFITEKLQQLVLLSSDFDNLKENPSGTNTHRCTLTLSNSTQWANSSVKYAPLCNVLQFFAFAGTEKYPCFDIRTNTLYVDLGLSLNDTKATLKNCADENNGIVLVGVKQTPTVINLTNEQINGFLNLHMYYPSTTVVSDCDSQLTYIADTKNYIDNKFNELATALVAHESEVM